MSGQDVRCSQDVRIAPKRKMLIKTQTIDDEGSSQANSTDPTEIIYQRVSCGYWMVYKMVDGQSVNIEDKKLKLFDETGRPVKITIREVVDVIDRSTCTDSFSK